MTAPPEAKIINSNNNKSSDVGDICNVNRIAIATKTRMMNQNIPSTTSIQLNVNHNPYPNPYGTAITDRSDIYAFGICIYYWATGGIQVLPMNHITNQLDMIAIKKSIPLKWKTWLHSLLDMCLQTTPELRASSKEIHLFLMSRFGKS